MEHLVIRVETGLRELIEELSVKKGHSLSEVARDLMRVGIGVERGGGLKIKGSLGRERRFADLSFGGGEEKLGVRISEDLLEKLEREIGGKSRPATRRSMRQGALVIWPEKIRIVGIFGVIRPFAEADSPTIKGREAWEALHRLRD